ncbi:MAG: TolC family protein [Cyclobacteriaceae bacterium]|nr:TolC family protein [Cyclobacteriaceae bacterium]
MKFISIIKTAGILFILVVVWSCNSLKPTTRKENKFIPEQYYKEQDTVTIAKLSWQTYFGDKNLVALIDTALRNNQELNIFLQEIEISKNEVRARKGEYLPFINLAAGAAVEKPGHYTTQGAVEEQLEVKPGTLFPEPLQDYMVGATATWEVDIWKKLRNARKAAAMKYLASIEGKNFLVTNLIAEIADAYYELMALDNLLDIINRNIELQSSALQVVTQQKEAAKVTQLGVNRFEAQLLNTKNLQFNVKQRIVEIENRLHFLTGNFSQPITRNSASFLTIGLDSIQVGIPSQLLSNRPDIRQAELELEASKLNVKVARANFYPSFGIRGGVGFQAFKMGYLINPESMMYNLTGDLLAPLVNRNAIKAAYKNANAKQLQAVYNYERTILNGYLDVRNQLSKIDNYNQSFETKNKEVEILMRSITIANNLFNSARADYAEVLLTQREALESKVDLVEIKMKQLNAKVNIYRALGGGWR